MNPPPKPTTLSEALNAARNEMVLARGTLTQARLDHGFADRIRNIEGLLTCGISTLYEVIREATELEIKAIDEDRGPHLQFGVRGIGLDVCPCCFVCGATQREPDANHFLHNIAAVVSSKADGETLVEWFGGRARLDFRPHQPHHIQLKVGACTAHLPNLQALERITSKHRVIRLKDIAEAIALR